MFDINKLKSAIGSIGSKVSKATASYMPSAMSEEKRFSNAYSASLALLVCADLEVEADETIAAIGFMQNDFCLKDRNLVLCSLEAYGDFILSLSESFGNQPTYILKKAQIIQEFINVSLSPAYKNDIRNLCNALIGANANPQERQVYNEIISALG